MDQTIPNSSSSLTLQRSSVEFRNRDANAIGFQRSGVFCSSAAPNSEREASHLTRTSSFGL